MFDTDNDRILDQLPPGPALAQLLAAIDVASLSGEDRVVVMRAHQRMASHYVAKVYGDIAAVSDAIHEVEDDPHLAHDSTAAEIGAALVLTRRAADGELHLALDLRRRLPAVYQLLQDGLLDARRARVVIHGTAHLSVAAAQQAVARIIDDAPNLTTGQLRAKLRRLCIDEDPADARDRYRHATDQRRVITEPTADGTAHLLAFDLPPDAVQQVTDRIDRLAKSLRRKGEVRTMDQLRADVYLDLLRGTPTTRVGTIDIRVDLETLVELSEHPGDLAGYGPIVADLTRQLAQENPSAEWRYTVTDPATGTAHTGTTRRRPTRSQRRNVQARDTACIFPGCRMPATQSDLDHRIRHVDGGPTHEDELAPLCRYHHIIKEHGWTYTALPGGHYRWTTKLGQTYITSGRSP